MSVTETLSKEILHELDDPQDKAMAESFLNRYDDLHFWLICHASFPVMLTSHLAYALAVNFQTDCDGNLLVNKNEEGLALYSVSEVLHAAIVREIGHDLYEIRPALKQAFLRYLQKQPEGMERLEQLAVFMQHYVSFCRMYIPTQGLTEAQILNYESYLLSPGQFAAKLIGLVSEARNTKDNIRKQRALSSIAYALGAELPTRSLQKNSGRAGFLSEPEALLLALDSESQFKINEQSAQGLEKLRQALRHLNETDQEGFKITIPRQVQDALIRDGLLKRQVRPTLHVLLVAINDYPQFHSLRGAVKDAENLEQWLDQNSSLDVSCTKLFDADATLNRIEEAFKAVSGQARPGDSLLFYFAGLGARENIDQYPGAPKYVKVLMCYEGDKSARPSFLSEFRLHELLYALSEKEVHITVMLDCGFSAVTTQNSALVRTAFAGNDVRERGLQQYLTGTRYDNTAWNRIKTTPLSAVNYIKISACHDHESAFEESGEGVFTGILGEVIDKFGMKLTYRQLIDQILQSSKFIYGQQPELRLYGNKQGLGNTVFLNEQGDAKQVIGEMRCDLADGWVLINFGALHGINTNTEIIVHDPASFDFSYMVIEKILTDRTLMTVKAGSAFQPDINRIYRVTINNIEQTQLKIHLVNYDFNPTILKGVVKALTSGTSGRYIFEMEESNSDYVLHTRMGQSYFTLPNDPYRPLFEPMLMQVGTEVDVLINTINNIYQWHIVRDLKMADQTLGADPLEIQVYSVSENGEDVQLAVIDDEIQVYYQFHAGSWRGRIKIKVTNRLNVGLYFSLLYVTPLFGVSQSFTNDRIIYLGAGDDVYLGIRGKQTIPIKLTERERDYNIESYKEHFKFIISTEEFDSSPLDLEELPAPFQTNQRYSRGKGMFHAEQRNVSAQIQNWITLQLNITFVNPVFNSIDLRRLKTLLEWEETAEFALGIYYDLELNPWLQPVAYILKPEIRLVNGENIQNDANDYTQDDAAQLTRWDIDYTAKNFKDRRYNLTKDHSERMLALGDSWFSYPLLRKDTIDHLARTYAIRNLSFPGNTIRRMSEDISRSDLGKLIREEKPKFILVSAGLWDMFNDALLENPDDFRQFESNPYESYFFHMVLSKLLTYHEQVIDFILSVDSSAKIIIHGYDYFLKLADSNGGGAFKAGNLRAHIKNQGFSIDQLTRIAKWMIDELNKSLGTLAMIRSNNVFHLDIRGTLSNADWADEFHPLNAGFNKIATAFRNRMEEIAHVSFEP